MRWLHDLRENAGNWIEDHLFISAKRARERAKNAFELGLDVGARTGLTAEQLPSNRVHPQRHLHSV